MEEKKPLRELLLPPNQCPVCKKHFLKAGNEFKYIEEKDIIDKSNIKSELCNNSGCHFGGFSAATMHWGASGMAHVHIPTISNAGSGGAGGSGIIIPSPTVGQFTPTIPTAVDNSTNIAIGAALFGAIAGGAI